MQLARGDVRTAYSKVLRRVDSARRRGLGVIRNNSPSDFWLGLRHSQSRT